MTTSANIIEEDGGKNNIYAVEPRMYIDPSYKGSAKEAELQNGRWAMIGFISALGAYAITGQILPGIF